ncbi:hypothetical protein POM88_000292 [Heracleum sosnowskyi]|uniref:Uncharacterized protein n=1 Tax=Heracleum sosnowskyi TaxID=360622 RepID=A0AAD8JAE7_9APIA|nr:hypothetical protein POM88_000292 [Heracleum sosnowskyi]
MKLLLAHKRDLMNVSDDYGWTVYHYLAYNDLHKIVHDLVSVDKSVGYRTDKEHKRTPLHVAAYEGKLNVMKELKKYFPDSLETVDGNGQNILHIAAEKEREEVISFILSLGFETCNNLLIQKDKNGNTPLHLLAKLSDCYSELMEIRAKVDWQVLDDKNFTPLDVLQMTDTQLAEQSIVRRVFNRNDIRKYWHLWGLRKKIDNEEQRKIKRGKEESLKEIRELLSTQHIELKIVKEPGSVQFIRAVKLHEMEFMNRFLEEDITSECTVKRTLQICYSSSEFKKLLSKSRALRFY